MSDAGSKRAGKQKCHPCQGRRGGWRGLVPVLRAESVRVGSFRVSAYGAQGCADLLGGLHALDLVVALVAAADLPAAKVRMPEGGDQFGGHYNLGSAGGLGLLGCCHRRSRYRTIHHSGVPRKQGNNRAQMQESRPKSRAAMFWRRRPTSQFGRSARQPRSCWTRP